MGSGGVGGGGLRGGGRGWCSVDSDDGIEGAGEFRERSFGKGVVMEPPSIIGSTSNGRYQVQLLFSLERRVPSAPVGEIILLCLGMIALS